MDNFNEKLDAVKKQIIMAVCSIRGEVHRSKIENLSLFDLMEYGTKLGLDFDILAQPIREASQHKQRTKGKITVRVG